MPKSVKKQYSCCQKFDQVELDDFIAEAKTGDVLIFDQEGIEYCWKCFLRSSWCAAVSQPSESDPEAPHGECSGVGQ